MFNIGDKVMLSDEGFTYWVEDYDMEVDSANPRNVEGVIIHTFTEADVFGDFFNVRVKWENGHTNSYRNCDVNKVMENV